MARADIAIRNRSYSIACAPGQEAKLQALGSKLEKRVQAIAKAVGDVGEERLYLIAALSMLDELNASQSGPASQASPASMSAETASASDVERRATTAILDAAARIEAIAQRAEARNRGS
ncbi:MAG: cell division protein ZapA [Pseudomonadota bacterium]